MPSPSGPESLFKNKAASFAEVPICSKAFAAAIALAITPAETS